MYVRKLITAYSLYSLQVGSFCVVRRTYYLCTQIILSKYLLIFIFIDQIKITTHLL